VVFGGRFGLGEERIFRESSRETRLLGEKGSEERKLANLSLLRNY
jgi:hypothetical protein